ncbi:UDP-glucuronosyltransferase 2B1-like [Drosophila innubila]|uniref:UDP-glucuronosyltransferase 2B1-like n=1 Tax=Drosophila innubila TaxID=198719 RepID=UPI00148BF7CD|nr:UDP-glucuronosyltransferase 2B1-like [Drosophila innubila]
MKLTPILLLTLVVSFKSAPQSEGAKILTTLGFPGRSQYIFVETYLKELAARGHEVTVISPFKEKPVPNVRFITAPKIHEYYDKMLKSYKTLGFWSRFKEFSWIFSTVCECILSDESVQQLMKSGETFDLFLAEMVQTESIFGLAQHFNATLMGFSSYGNDYIIDELMGNISPLSYNPHITSPRSNTMTFYERLENRWDIWMEKLAFHLIHTPVMREQYAKYFPNAKKTLSELMDSFELILLGQHFTLSYARPYMPNMIEVGGIHISNKPKPIPEDIKQFIESAPEGVIYFSLGSNVKSKNLPKETREILLKVFGGLKQRVLWKFEDDQLPNKPRNVFISKWFPQSDILAHPKVRLFISHGGLLSTIESVYYGKPILGLPVFYDQFMNVKRATDMGYCLGLDLLNLKQSELEQTINTLLTTPRYAQAAVLISQRYKDQPETALDRAIWWTEYVIRHKGTPHMRATSRNMSFVQLHGLDTLPVLIGLPILALLLLAQLSYWLLRRALGSKQQRSDKQKRQ